MFYCSWKERGEKRKSYRAAANYQSCRALLPRHRSVPTAAERETELKGCSELPPEPSALTLSQSSPAPHQTRSLFLAGQIGEERREALLSPRPGHTWPAPVASAGTGTRLHLAGVSQESSGEQGRAAAGGQHPQQPLLPGARAERGAVGTSVRPQQSAPALCFSPHCLLRRAGARESTECDQDKSHTTLW